MRSLLVGSIVLTIILIATSLLLDKLMGLFITSIIACMLLDKMGYHKQDKKPDDEEEA